MAGGTHKIKKPPNGKVQAKGGTLTLQWGDQFAGRRSEMFQRKQAICDSEVLRYCAPYIPFRTGALTRSGIIGTVIGSGQVQYSTPYARFQYYATAETRDYDPRRGAQWFERMKPAHREDILRAVEKG